MAQLALRNLSNEAGLPIHRQARKSHLFETPDRRSRALKLTSSRGLVLWMSPELLCPRPVAWSCVLPPCEWTNPTVVVRLGVELPRSTVWGGDHRDAWLTSTPIAGTTCHPSGAKPPLVLPANPLCRFRPRTAIRTARDRARPVRPAQACSGCLKLARAYHVRGTRS